MNSRNQPVIAGLTFARFVEIFNAAKSQDKELVEYFFQRFLSSLLNFHKEPAINFEALAQLLPYDEDLSSPEAHAICAILETKRHAHSESAVYGMGTIVQILVPVFFPHDDNFEIMKKTLQGGER